MKNTATGSLLRFFQYSHLPDNFNYLGQKFKKYIPTVRWWDKPVKRGVVLIGSLSNLENKRKQRVLVGQGG
jgi:hypothetical protein